MPEVYHSVMNGGYLPIVTNGWPGDHQKMAEPEPPPTWRFYIPKDVPIINIIKMIYPI